MTTARCSSTSLNSTSTRWSTFSATPGEYERTRSGQIVEQLIRPTGLLDPEVEVRPIEGQVDDLMGEIRTRSARGERVLVTTLTKKMAEDLSGYLDSNRHQGANTSTTDVETMERMEIVRDLRLGVFDVLVGINLLTRGAGHTRGVAGGDPRRGQGGFPPSARPR